MIMRLTAVTLIMVGSAVLADGAPTQGRIAQISQHMGEMSMEMTFDTKTQINAEQDTLRFEPWQMVDDLFRNDIVILMRHGPTDWSRRDKIAVAPTDCRNQRVMTEAGQKQMREMGILLAGNGIIPGEIIASEWCRNQQTLNAITTGMELIDPDFDATVQTRSEVNLLLSLQGAPNVTALRDFISTWEGDEDGPLLIISHFTNIAELTEFHVYEGEALVIDPKRENRVLGYLRLKSAAPDIGHFDASVVP